jgi:hypothetical protein
MLLELKFCKVRIDIVKIGNWAFDSVLFGTAQGNQEYLKPAGGEIPSTITSR